MEPHTAKWGRIIRWKGAYAVPKMGWIPRGTANHQCKRVTLCTSRKKRTISRESSEGTPVRAVVWAHIVPDRVMSYDLLLGRDRWDHFPVRKYRKTDKDETVVAFTAQDDGSAAGDHRFKNWVVQAIGMIESTADCKVVVSHADKSCMLSEGFTWVKAELRNCDGSDADPRSYYERFHDGWTPNEAIVDAGLSDIPLQRAEGSDHHLRSQATLGFANTRLRKVNLVNAKVIPQDSTSPQQATLTKETKTSDTTPTVKKTERDKGPPQPPQNAMTQLDPQQQNIFSKLEFRIPEHLRIIRFGLDNATWQPQEINALGDTLWEFEHRCSKHSTNLGHVTVDPFRIILKQDATPPVKQKPYRHSQVSLRKFAPRLTSSCWQAFCAEAS